MGVLQIHSLTQSDKSSGPTTCLTPQGSAVHAQRLHQYTQQLANLVSAVSLHVNFLHFIHGISPRLNSALFQRRITFKLEYLKNTV